MLARWMSSILDLKSEQSRCLASLGVHMQDQFHFAQFQSDKLVDMYLKSLIVVRLAHESTFFLTLGLHIDSR